MARVALGLGVRELAKLAGVSPDTVARFERGEKLRPNTTESMQNALRELGIEFIEQNGGGPGVRFK